MLANDTLLHPWLSSLEGHQKRAEVEDDRTEPVNATKPITTWFHCSIGQILAPDDAEEDDNLQVSNLCCSQNPSITDKIPFVKTTQIQPIRGFDRLASVGFSQPDIESLRQHFHTISSSNYLDHHFTGDEDCGFSQRIYLTLLPPKKIDTCPTDDEHIRNLEDQWMDSVAADSGPAFLSSSFPNSSILQGILTGFFFPFLPFFLANEEKPAVFWENSTEHEAPNILFS